MPIPRTKLPVNKGHRGNTLPVPNRPRSLARAGYERIGRGVYVDPAAEAGGNLRALGYVPPGQLTQAEAIVYDRLIANGLTPNHALSIVHSKAGQINSLTSRELNDIAIGAGSGAVIGGILGGPLAALTAPIGALLGGAAGAIAGLFSSNSPPKNATGRPQSHPIPRSEMPPTTFEGDENPYAVGLAAIPRAITEGERFANSIGSFFGGPAATQPIESQPPGAPIANAPAGQPFYDNPSTEEIPPVYGPSPQPIYTGYDAPEPNFAPQPGEYFPPPAYSPQPGDIDLQPPGRQPSYSPNPGGYPSFVPQGGGGGNIPLNSPQDCPTCQDIDQLIHQTDEQIAKEQQQENSPSNETPDAVQNQIQHLAQQLQHFRQLEQQPPSQRDIDSEIRQKRSIRNQLVKLRQKAQQLAQSVRFCMVCQTEQDAIEFFNGQGDGAGCTVISSSKGDGDQRALQPPDAHRGFASPPILNEMVRPPMTEQQFSAYVAEHGPQETIDQYSGYPGAGQDNAEYRQGANTDDLRELEMEEYEQAHGPQENLN